MSDGRFEKENTAANGTAASSEVRVDRAALIEAFGLIDDKYIDEAREPYDTVLPVKAAADNTAAPLTADDTGASLTAGRNTSTGQRSGTKTGTNRTRRFAVWFSTAAAVLVLAVLVPVVVLVLRGGDSKARESAKSDQYGNTTLIHDWQKVDEDGIAPNGSIPEPSIEFSEVTTPPDVSVEPGYSTYDPTAAPSDNSPDYIDNSRFEAEHPGYSSITLEDEPVYSRTQDLVDAAEFVFVGSVVNVSYDVLYENGTKAARGAASYYDGAMLYTIYTVKITEKLKTRYTVGDTIQVAVPGGILDTDTEQQLQAMISSGLIRSCSEIPVVRDLVPLKVDGQYYIFFLHSGAVYFSPLTLGQYAYPTDSGDSDWLSAFDNVLLE